MARAGVIMKTLLIDSYKADKEGVSLHFNEKFSPNGGITVDEVWVSWDRIGRALYPTKYSEESNVEELRKMRAEGKGEKLYEASVVKEIMRMGEQSLSPQEFEKLEGAVSWIKRNRQL